MSSPQSGRYSTRFSQVFRIEHIRHELEIANCLTDRQLKLMPVKEPCELAPRLLPLARRGEQDRILTEEDAA